MRNLLWIDRKGSGSRFKYLRYAQLNLLNAEGVYIAPSHRHRYHFSKMNVKCNEIEFHPQLTFHVEYIITYKFKVRMMRKKKLWVMAFAPQVHSPALTGMHIGISFKPLNLA